MLGPASSGLPALDSDRYKLHGVLLQVEGQARGRVDLQRELTVPLAGAVGLALRITPEGAYLAWLEPATQTVRIMRLDKQGLWTLAYADTILIPGASYTVRAVLDHEHLSVLVRDVALIAPVSRWRRATAYGVAALQAELPQQATSRMLKGQTAHTSPIFFAGFPSFTLTDNAAADLLDSDGVATLASVT